MWTWSVLIGDRYHIKGIKPFLEYSALQIEPNDWTQVILCWRLYWEVQSVQWETESPYCSRSTSHHCTAGSIPQRAGSAPCQCFLELLEGVPLQLSRSWQMADPTYKCLDSLLERKVCPQPLANGFHYKDCVNKWLKGTVWHKSIKELILLLPTVKDLSSKPMIWCKGR